MYCENCGYEITEGKRFCARCGTAVPNNVRPTDAYAQKMVRSNDGAALSRKGRKQKLIAILVLVIGLIVGITLIVIGAGMQKEAKSLSREQLRQFSGFTDEHFEREDEYQDVQGKSIGCIAIGTITIFLSIGISSMLFVFSQRYTIANYAGKTLGVALKSAAREFDSNDERNRN